MSESILNKNQNKNLRVIKQLNIMIVLTMITQLFILIKNAIVASYFGISAELDAFNLSNRISTFIYSFIGAGISTVIIPYLRDKINKQAINIFISAIFKIGFLLLVLMIIFNNEIISLAGGSDDTYFIKLSANLLIFTALTGFINSVIQLAKGILEYNEKFNIQKLIVLFSNIVLIIMLLLGNNNIYYYAFVIFFTAFLNLCFHIFFLRKTKFDYRINFNIKNPIFKEMMITFFPTMLSTGVYQISLLIDTLIAARLPVGSISTLNYANSVISMINVLLIGNITTFVYPKLVKKNTNKERQTSLIGYILLMNMLMCLLIVAFYSSGKEGISILFERGNFTNENTFNVYKIGLILMLALPTNAIRDLLYRYFYMNKDTYTPFKNSIMISLINIVISIILSKYLGLYGVVIGTVLASYFSLLFISIRFKRKFELYFNTKIFFLENIKVFVVTVLSFIASMVFKGAVRIENTFIGIFVYFLFSLIVYILFLILIKSKIFKVNL